MINGIYSSASGMDAEMVRQDVISNNLANASTKGFKKDVAVFTAFPNALVQRINDRMDNHAGVQAAGHALGVLGHGVQTHAVVTSFTDGSVVKTGNPLDLAVKGDALFTVERADGSHAYTRSGNFAMNAEGNLATMNGEQVLGVNDAPINVNGREVVIDVRGRILVDGSEAGQLQFAAWDPERFSKMGESLYVKSEPLIEAKEDVAAYEGTVQQGYLEEANLKVVEEMVSMITVMRSYEANQKAVQMQDETLGKAVNEVGKI
ncbi:MAG: flagellar hook-basal body protein [candidate division FCPU426 bacterium]